MAPATLKGVWIWSCYFILIWWYPEKISMKLRNSILRWSLLGRQFEKLDTNPCWDQYSPHASFIFYLMFWPSLHWPTRRDIPLRVRTLWSTTYQPHLSFPKACLHRTGVAFISWAYGLGRSLGCAQQLMDRSFAYHAYTKWSCKGDWKGIELSHLLNGRNFPSNLNLLIWMIGLDRYFFEFHQLWSSYCDVRDVSC